MDLQQLRPMADCSVVLYRSAPAWGLPSFSVGCLQVETYLRLGKVPFAVQDCSSPSASPTGQVPAVDTSSDLVGADMAGGVAAPLAEFAAARTMLDYLKAKVIDLDHGLTASQHAEAAAFTALVEAKLQPAIIYTTWCESDAFVQHTQPTFAAGMPFPLSYFIPRAQRKALMQQFAATTGSRVYQDAVDALNAVAMRLASSGGGSDFFFGSRPSSMDALLYSCLVYLRSAPVVHPQLRRKLLGHRQLGSYVDRIGQLAYSAAVPAVADANLDWSSWGSGQAADDKYSKAKTERESELQRKGRRWLVCAAAAIAAYVFLSGQYVQSNMLSGFELEDEDDDE